MENETNTAIMGLELAISKVQQMGWRKENTTINIMVDNLAVLYLINKGRCKWNISIFKLFCFLKFFNKIKALYKLKASYINTADNPADVLSREGQTN